MENMNMPVMPMQSSKAGMIATAVGVLVVGLVVGFLIGKGGSDKQVAVTTATPTFSNMPDNKAAWKTYINTEYGFEFKYPGEWEISDDSSHSNNVFVLSTGKLAGDSAIWINGIETQTLDIAVSDIVKRYSGAKITKKESIIIGGKNGTLVSFTVGDSAYRWAVVEEKPQLFVAIGITVDVVPFSAGYDQILSTFKFTK